MISAVVLTKNSENRIGKCLESLAWCGEILVINDNSTDRTLDAVVKTKLNQVQILTHSLSGDFASQHNFALTKTKFEWILFVDDDEIVSPILAKEITQAIASDGTIGYYIPRRDFFFGKFLKFGETGSVRFLRLARKNSGVWERRVHEFWKIAGETKTLKNPIDHFAHPTIKQFIDSINDYTTIDASELSKEGKKFSYLRVFLNPLGKFIQNYFLKLGILDGTAGFVMALMMSLHSLIVRVKQYDFPKSA